MAPSGRGRTGANETRNETRTGGLTAPTLPVPTKRYECLLGSLVSTNTRISHGGKILKFPAGGGASWVFSIALQ